LAGCPRGAPRANRQRPAMDSRMDRRTLLAASLVLAAWASHVHVVPTRRTRRKLHVRLWGPACGKLGQGASTRLLCHMLWHRLWAVGVRVWQITSGGRRPPGRRPPRGRGLMLTTLPGLLRVRWRLRRAWSVGTLTPRAQTFVTTVEATENDEASGQPSKPMPATSESWCRLGGP
jgi:hypothetical protein